MIEMKLRYISKVTEIEGNYSFKRDERKWEHAHTLAHESHTQQQLENTHNEGKGGISLAL